MSGTSRGEFLVRVANLLNARRLLAAGPARCEVVSVAVLVEGDRTAEVVGGLESLPPEVCVEVKLAGGEVFRLRAEDVTGRIPDL
ncbi:MAG TPA: hypothetical protein VJV23_07290 [Candidatus Polarisedimenticolia bacterium]|nr:hypothetical protein [Candidatus Polarisedimenticolia bacterium]